MNLTYIIILIFNIKKLNIMGSWGTPQKNKQTLLSAFLRFTDEDALNPDHPAYYWQPKYSDDWYLPDSTFYLPMFWIHDEIDNNSIEIKYGFDEYNKDEDTKAFWKDWVRNEIEDDSEQLLGRDGYYTFANNLTWFDRRIEHHRILTHKMYIAYAYFEKESYKKIMIAVCVLVEPGAVYTTLGITKSTYARKMRGLALKLQAYTAQAVVHHDVDPKTHGLLFRPNGIMLNIILKAVGRVTDGMGGHALVGSSKDGANQKKMRLGPGGLMDLPKHIVDDSADHMMIYIHPDYDCEQENIIHFQTPFWEPPTPYANPDSSLNPHLPLVFIPIHALLTLSDASSSSSSSS